MPFSIYRGYCTKGGFGELPTDKPGDTPPGEQFLGADKELWEYPGLADAVRTWMTLYDDSNLVKEIGRRLGERVEAWSYFGYRDFRFVARLTSGGEFGSRMAYFAHSQAWLENDFQNDYDPGALLGVSEAFHGHWKEGQRLERLNPVQPAMVWSAIVQDNPWPAINLIAQLYHARVSNCPVVMAVPLQEFVEGGRVHQLVSFARAALPREIKRDCRIRVFTGRPEIYLGELNAHLVVIPEDLASNALRARPDAALLDSNCKLKSGPKADTSYAEKVVERVRKIPDGLLLFTGRLNFPAMQLPAPAKVSILTDRYNMATAWSDKTTMDHLLERLCDEAARGLGDRDWVEQIQADEWRQFSIKKLKEVALRLAKTPGLDVLRQGARVELARQNIVLDDEAPVWIASLRESLRWPEELSLLQANLLSHPVRYQGGDSQKGGTTTAEDLRWLIQRARKAPLFRSTVDARIAGLVAERRIPAGLTPNDLMMLDEPDSKHQLEDYLNWAEILDLTGSDQGKYRIERLEHSLRDAEQHRDLFNRLQKPHWRALKEYFISPEEWDDNVFDLLLQCPSQLNKITDIKRLLRLAGATKALPDNVVRILDKQMESQPEETTRFLIDARRWLAWREKTGLKGLRECAKKWMSSAGKEATSEEWMQVMLDLGSISSEDIKELRTASPNRKPPWPQIPLWEEQQIKDMAESCIDLGAATELAEAIGSVTRNSVFRDVLDFFRKRHPIPGVISEEGFRCLSRGESNDSPLRLAEASALLQLAGNRQTQALGVLGSSVLWYLPELPIDAEAAANDATLWEKQHFRERVPGWLRTNPWRPEDKNEMAALRVLDCHINESWSTAEKPDEFLQKLAESYRKYGLINLANFLSPNVYKNVLSALIDDKPQDRSWKEMIDAVVNSVSSLGIDQHPLMCLAQEIKWLPPEQQRKLDRKGWQTFQGACAADLRTPCLFDRHRGTLPILQLAAILRDDRGLGRVASDVLRLQGIKGKLGEPEWWKTFFDVVESCPRRSVIQETMDRLDAILAVLHVTMLELGQCELGLAELENRRAARLPSQGVSATLTMESSVGSVAL